MKDFANNWWKFAIVIMVAGMILFGIALGMGARGGALYFDKNGAHITSFANHKGDAYVTVSEHSLDAFSSIDVSAVSEKVRLIPSDHYGLEIHMPEGTAPDWNLTGGKLTVRTNPESGFYLFNLDLSFDNDSVYVYYPQNAAFDEVKISSASGSVELSGLTASEISISNVSGSVSADVTLKDGNVSIDTASGRIKFSGAGSAKKVYLKSVSGSINAEVNDCAGMTLSTSSGSITARTSGQTATLLEANSMSGAIKATGAAWRSLKAETTSGSIEISGRLTGQSSITSMSGGITISAKGSFSEYGYDLDSMSGSIRINGERFGRPARSLGAADAANVITASTASGSIRLDFSE